VLVLFRPSRGEVRLPKGHVEEGESHPDAAIREVAEEAGFDDLEIVCDLGFQAVEFVRTDEAGKRWDVRREEHFYLMVLQSARTRERAPEELKFTPVWLPWDVALVKLTFQAEREWVRRALVARGY